MLNGRQRNTFILCFLVILHKVEAIQEFYLNPIIFLLHVAALNQANSNIVDNYHNQTDFMYKAGGIRYYEYFNRHQIH